MKRSYIYRSLLGIVCIALSLSFSGCLKEDLSRCPQDLPRVRVIPDALPDGIMPELSDLQSVRLYVFDQDRNFIGTIVDGVAGEWITLDYPDAGSLYVVAVANQERESESIPAFESGDFIDESVISVKNTGTQDGRRVYCSPSDLFHGTVQVDNHRTESEDRDLPVTRITSQTNIEIKGMKKHYGLDSGNLTVAVLNRYHSVNLSRKYTGHEDNSPVVHHPSGSFREADLHTTSTFHLLSGDAGQQISLEVYDGDTLIETFTRDQNGDPFVAVNGRLLEIRISYVGQLAVVIQDYGQWIIDEPIEQEF